MRFLLFEAHCDPNVRNKDGLLALEMTVDPETILIMCQYKSLDVSSKAVETWMNNSEIIDANFMIRLFKVILQNQNFEENTLLHLTCRNVFQRNNVMVLTDYLLTEANCDPNCTNNNGKMPLQLTSDAQVMAKLVKHGAKVTSDVVFNLVIECTNYTVFSEILAVSTTKETLFWNPDDLNTYGNTALHTACVYDKPAIVCTLLEEGHCSPHVKKQKRRRTD